MDLTKHRDHTQCWICYHWILGKDTNTHEPQRQLCLMITQALVELFLFMDSKECLNLCCTKTQPQSYPVAPGVAAKQLATAQISKPQVIRNKLMSHLQN